MSDAPKVAKKDKKKEPKPTSSGKGSELVPRDLQSVLKSRFFVVPSFDIYGGKAGFFDLGPPMASLEQNVLQRWRKHFIVEERMVEISCSIITPYRVLKSSGHVDKFTDLLVHDTVTNESFRADHLLEHFVEKKLATDPKLTEEQKKELEYIQTHADAFSPEETKAVIEKWGVTSDAGNKLDDPSPFNMMFQTKIGPTGKDEAFLRPEIAQGMFTNFRNCLDYMNGRLPFAAAQFGKAFRNEIAPKGGLFRLREFTLAEFEHFYDPIDSRYPKFNNVKDVRVRLLSNVSQEAGNMEPVELTLEEAHRGRRGADGEFDPSTALIQNETLAYFIGRALLFFLSIGLKYEKLRFRQHLKSQLAHYARDCWDAEALAVDDEGKATWVEIAGVSDRSCYDLTVHMKATRKPMVAQRRLSEPKTFPVAIPNKQMIGKQYKQKGQAIIKFFEEMEPEAVASMKDSLTSGKTVDIQPYLPDSEDTVTVTPEMVTFKDTTVHVENFVPNVVEPSFGISRIIFAIIQQNFSHRDPERQRCVVSFQPSLAPFSAVVLPLQGDDQLREKALEIEALVDLPLYVDYSTVSIGKRYSRADEVGVPFAVTVDYDTLKDNKVTVRDRDTTQQVRVNAADVHNLLTRLIAHQVTWEAVAKEYGLIQINEKDLE